MGRHCFDVVITLRRRPIGWDRRCHYSIGHFRVDQFVLQTPPIPCIFFDLCRESIVRRLLCTICLLAKIIGRMQQLQRRRFGETTVESNNETTILFQAEPGAALLRRTLPGLRTGTHLQPFVFGALWNRVPIGLRRQEGDRRHAAGATAGIPPDCLPHQGPNLWADDCRGTAKLWGRHSPAWPAEAVLDGVDAGANRDLYGGAEASSNCLHGLRFLLLDHFVFFHFIGVVDDDDIVYNK